MSLELPSSRATSPPRLMIYGPEGIGKSTLASQAPNPVVLDVEDGFRALDVPTFGLLRSYDAIAAAIQQLLDQDHSYQTVIVDTLDAVEPLVWLHTCQKHHWANIETPGFGKGFLLATEQWRHLLDGLDALRDQRGMAVILTAHAEIRRFDHPECEPFERYQPRLQTRASALIRERVDAALFLNYKVNVTKANIGFNKSIVRGVGGGDRFIYTTERPSAIAKNRFGMPDMLPLSWEALAAAIPYYCKGN